MVAHRYWTIWCDSECGAWIGHEHTATQGRRHARVFGWHRSHGRDICPECWSEGTR